MKNRCLNDINTRDLARLKIEFRHLIIMLSLGSKGAPGAVIIFIMPVEGMGALRLVCA
jgi:hypothetical protein